ncbi:MAG TPA: hypothetical protein VND65_06090 [Candidatus Binatia bacterium]|nr:hypothetical protein [Candidatus Binatia bacterium]
MKNDRATSHVTFALVLLSAVTLAVLAMASDSASKPTDVPATVIAHLPLPQATGNEMLLQKQEGKHYLYIQQSGKTGFMIVDVSKPEHPNLLKRTAEQNQSTSGNLEMVSPDIAIAEAPDKTPGTLTSNSHPTETVRVLDLSDPRNPKTLETFNKVTGILADGGHGLLYLTNNDGLWILRYNHPSRLEPEKKKRPCGSEDEIQAMPPDCE